MPYITKPQQVQQLERNLQKQTLRNPTATKLNRPSADDDCWCEEPFLTYIEVEDSGDIPTGILDVDGYEYYRIRNPIGFIWY